MTRYLSHDPGMLVMPFVFIVLYLCPHRSRRNHTMLPDKDGPGVGGGQSSSEGEDPSVSLFREYLRLKTVHPDPDYGEISSSQYTNQAMSFGNVTVGFFFSFLFFWHLSYFVRVWS